MAFNNAAFLVALIQLCQWLANVLDIVFIEYLQVSSDFLSKNIYNLEAKDIQDGYFSFLVFSSSSFFISCDLLQFRRSVVTMQAYLMSFRGARLITVFESDGTNA